MDVVRIRVFAGLALCSLLFVGAGVGALAAILEGRAGIAVPLLMAGALLAGAMLGTQASLRRRLTEGDRMVALLIVGGSGSLVALLCFLFVTASMAVGDWDLAAVLCALMGAFGLVAGISVSIYRSSRSRVLPPFRPLRPESFRETPDPPAYAPPPREARVVRPPGGFIDRMLRALWLRR
jgi:hypothetical protein